MQRPPLVLSLLFAAVTLGCSSDPPAEGGDDGTGGGQSGSAGQGGGAGSTATGGSSGSSTGGSSGAGMTGGSSSGGSAGNGATGGSSTGGSGGSGTGGGSGWTKTGSCRQGGKAMVMGSAYEGTEDFWILSQEALSEGLIDPVPANLVCQIRFDVARSGEGPAGCVDLDDAPCEWSQEVEFSNPQVLIDVDGACGNSEAQWNSAWADMIDGSRASYGYVDEYEGHSSVVMRYSTSSSSWQVLGTGHWDDETGELGYEAIVGPCQY